MLPALAKYEAALRDPKIPAKGIVRMAKEAAVTEADVIAARAELAAKVVETVAKTVAEIAPTVAEVVAELTGQAGGPEVDADAARDNLEQAGAVVVEVAEHVADLVEVIAAGPRMKPRKALDVIFAIFGVTDSDHDGDVDALDTMHAVFAAITRRPARGVTVEPAAPAREPGAAVRALRTARIVDANGRPWRVSFRDVYSGDKADFLVKHHPALVEPFPPKR